nr:MAG TPA_asm: hypothetical protein [Caudoviricetes sp.]
MNKNNKVVRFVRKQYCIITMKVLLHRQSLKSIVT